MRLKRTFFRMLFGKHLRRLIACAYAQLAPCRVWGGGSLQHKEAADEGIASSILHRMPTNLTTKLNLDFWEQSYLYHQPHVSPTFCICCAAQHTLLSPRLHSRDRNSQNVLCTQWSPRIYITNLILRCLEFSCLIPKEPNLDLVTLQHVRSTACSSHTVLIA